MLNMFILSGLFLALFAVGEAAYHLLKIQAEYTRKIVHVGTGILTMLFPVMLDSHWYVLCLCASFWLILQLSLKYGFLKSINAIDRSSSGSVLYPVIVYLMFCFYVWLGTYKMYFYLPILTMAFCDPAAALAGKKYGVKKYHIGYDTKSYIGSFAFFAISVPLSLACLWFTFGYLSSHFLFLALLIAFVSSFAEAVSGKGSDNFSIPCSVAFILYIYL